MIFVKKTILFSYLGGVEENKVKKSTQSRLHGSNAIVCAWLSCILFLFTKAILAFLLVVVACVYCVWAIKGVEASTAALKEKSQAMSKILNFRNKYNGVICLYLEERGKQTLRSRELFDCYARWKAGRVSTKTTTDEGFWNLKQISLQEEKQKDEEGVNDPLSDIRGKYFELRKEIEDILDQVKRSDFDTKLVEEMLPELEQRFDNLKTTASSILQNEEEMLQKTEKLIQGIRV